MAVPCTRCKKRRACMPKRRGHHGAKCDLVPGLNRDVVTRLSSSVPSTGVKSRLHVRLKQSADMRSRASV